MDIQSFYDLTPDEFEEVYKKWAEQRDATYKNEWDQTRVIAYQVYLSNTLLKSKKTMKGFLPFPWDKNKKGKTQSIRDPERFERLKNEYGKTI
jgi:hypothetical protein